MFIFLCTEIKKISTLFEGGRGNRLRKLRSVEMFASNVCFFKAV